MEHPKRTNHYKQFQYSTAGKILLIYTYKVKTENSLPPEPDFPRSAKERWMGLFVWCLCFLSKTKLILSLSSGPINPSSI